jgi:beta-amylase
MGCAHMQERGESSAERAQAAGRDGAKMYRFKPRHDKVHLGVKLAGVHWCSKSLGHAAELTAGYYHTAHHNGYRPIMQMLSRHGAQVRLRAAAAAPAPMRARACAQWLPRSSSRPHAAQVSFTCVEMRDCEQPDEGACGPEALLKLVIETAAEQGVRVTGENALQRCARAASAVLLAVLHRVPLLHPYHARMLTQLACVPVARSHNACSCMQVRQVRV